MIRKKSEKEGHKVLSHAVLPDDQEVIGTDVSAVIQEFNPHELLQKNPRTGTPLTNYWGYSTINFFSPAARYSSTGSRGQQVTEFKEMVRELHTAGIEVILDIVFNHTAEGNHLGPTLCFRGIDNAARSNARHI